MKIRIRYILLAILLILGAYSIYWRIDRSKRSKMERQEQIKIWESAFAHYLKVQNISSRQIQSRDYPEISLGEKKIRIPSQQSFTRLNLDLTEIAVQNHILIGNVTEDVKKRNLILEVGPPGFIFSRIIFIKDEKLAWNPARIALILLNSEDKALLEDFARLDTKFTYSLDPHNEEAIEILRLVTDNFQEYAFQCPVSFDPIHKSDLFSINPAMSEREIRDRFNRGMTKIEGGKAVVLSQRIDDRNLRIFESMAQKTAVPIVTPEILNILQDPKDPAEISLQIKKWIQGPKRNLIVGILPSKNMIRALEIALPPLYREGIEFVFLSDLAVPR